MKVIGLTGSIGSGKSTVSGFFKKLGAIVIDADQVSRQVVEPGSPALKELTVAFGENILNPDGSLNRTLVAEIVFNSDEKRELLNSIIHPMIFNEINSTIEEYREKGTEIIILEAALILEKKGLIKLIDKLIVVSIDEETQKKRLEGRGDLSKEQINARINSQLTNNEKIKHADYIIDNNQDLVNTREQVRELWDKLT
ncbi:MAG: dephospho-CoA kinase [Thermodesulfobacteriota bacterium]